MTAALVRFAAMLLLSTRLLAAEPFVFTDDFTRHPAGSDGAPAWDALGLGWSMGTGVFTSSAADRDHALVAAAPRGTQVTIQADCRVRGTTAKAWKLAGLSVRDDERNYWHLGLVEGPDDQGRKHFVELSEMLDGVWLAQGQPATHLAQTAGQGFAWEADHAYRLRLELTATGISGQVLEPDGTVRAHLGFAFGQARAVRSGRPSLTAAGLRADFSAFSARVDGVLPALKPPVPAYDGRRFAQATITGKATGFIHVEEIQGRWWAVDPLGRAFVIIGTDHANYQVHWCEKLGYAPYHRNAEKKHGSEAAWGDSTLARLDAWGFNCLGANPSRSIIHRGMPHAEFLSFGADFAGIDGITPRTTWTGFPNVFSPQWPAYCAKQARRQCAIRKDDPWIIGYFIDNELEWHPNTGGGILADSCKKPADHSAKQALVALLRSRHAAVADFNRAWGTTLASFDALLGLAALPPARTPEAQADERAFLRLVAERYFAVAVGAIRAADPNHMILGCRFAGSAPDILDIAGKYSDIFTINCYRTLDLETGAMVDGFEEELKRWHEQAGRPMLITEWSFPALDAGLPCQHGAGQRVPTQKDKAFAFTAFQKLLFTTPYLVGSNYFMWADEPAQGISSTFPEDSNYGLVDEQDEPYALLTQAATRLHAKAEAIHAGRMMDVTVEAGADGCGLAITNHGSIPGGGVVHTWIDGQERSEPLAAAPGAIRAIPLPAELLVRPGMHAGICALDLAEPLLQSRPGRPLAWAAVCTPGLPWAEGAKSASARVVLALVNPTDRVQEHQMVTLPLAELKLGDVDAARIAVYDEQGRPLAAQVDALADGAELAIAIDRLDAHAARTAIVYAGAGRPALPDAVAFTRTVEGYEVANGVLTLVKSDAKNGIAFDHIQCGGIDHGRFGPLLNQRSGHDRWNAPSHIDSVSVSNGPVRLVLDVTASAVGETPFRTGYRFVVEPGRPWFSSRCLWVENSGTAAWELGSYFHYLSSQLPGTVAVRGDRWCDAVSGRCIGVVAGMPIAVMYWMDPQGHGHPDAYRRLDLMLSPGQRHVTGDPAAWVVAGTEGGWSDLKRQVARGSALAWKAFAVETR